MYTNIPHRLAQTPIGKRRLTWDHLYHKRNLPAKILVSVASQVRVERAVHSAYLSRHIKEEAASTSALAIPSLRKTTISPTIGTGDMDISERMRSYGVNGAAKSSRTPYQRHEILPVD